MSGGGLVLSRNILLVWRLVRCPASFAYIVPSHNEMSTSAQLFEKEFFKGNEKKMNQ